MSPHRRSLVTRLRDRLAEPRVRAVDVDSDELLLVQRAMLREKRMLRQVFEEIYRLCLRLDGRHLRGDGLRVEIGAGTSFFKELDPALISTDVKSAPHLDRVVDAMAMPFPEASVRVLFGINCFHHFPDPERFFRELSRVLGDGGGAILVEPYHGALARAFYTRVFDSERFDRRQAQWSDPSLTAMRGANQALSYIVFERDRERLVGSFPELEIVDGVRLTNQVRYLASGGLNFRQLAPDWTIPLLRLVEAAASPLAPLLALHHAIVLRRRSRRRDRD